MKSFPIVILGGGAVAGYAAKEFVAQSAKGLQNARNLKSLDTTFGRQE